MSDIKTVLILGAYGLVGREIAGALIEKTKLNVIVSGRDQTKLDGLLSELDRSRAKARILDAFNHQDLARACSEANLVINCVGPYSMGGAEIARVAIESGVSYIDFANEQVHYQRLKNLDRVAREHKLVILTAAGLIPGISALLMIHAAKTLPDVESMEAFYAQGRMPDPNSGIGSLMSGALEACFQPVTLRNGFHIRAQLGKDRIVAPMPEPFGATAMIAVPTIETIVVPERVPLRSMEVYWAMGDVPRGFFSLMRLLKPHQRGWAYRLLRHMVDWMSRHDYEQAVKKNLSPECVIKIIACSPRRRWESTVSFRDGGIATAYLPVVAAKRFADDHLDTVGLVTAMDLFELDSLRGEMSDLGWDFPIKEQIYEDDLV